jgi:hypothetical protein
LDPRKSEGDENDIFLRILFPGKKNICREEDNIIKIQKLHLN